MGAISKAKSVLVGKTKVGGLGLGEAVEVALMKSVEETVQAPIVGNGTFLSSVVKLAEGVGVGMLSQNKHAKRLSLALMIDSAEDGVNALMGVLRGK